MRIDLNPTQIMEYGKQVAELTQLVQAIEKREQALTSISDLRNIENEELKKGDEGKEMIELARLEREELEQSLKSIESDLVKLLTPKDKDDEKDIVIEVRAGTGGDEASLFASEVFRMYQKFATLKGWKWEELSLSKSEIGGFKEAQAQISSSGGGENDSVFKLLKFESGVHRVQRIPVNDTKIQTSACSVIVLPAASELDIDIRPQDLRIDVYRSGGAGGQSVNKTESAVRITHLPTGLVVAMQVRIHKLIVFIPIQ